jgi:restriction system protein
MSVPDFQTLMLPVLRCAAEGEVTVSDCIAKITPLFGLSDNDLNEMLPSGRQTVIANRVHWAKLYMTKAGLIRMVRRGVFAVSEKGRELLATNPARIDKGTLSQYPDYMSWIDKRGEGASGGTGGAIARELETDIATPEEHMEASYAELAASLRTEVLERLLDASAAFFEQVIVDLLVAMGYGGGRAEMGKAIGRSGDEGIDGIVKEDPLGLDVVYVQAKRYKPSIVVGRPDIQKFAGSLEGFGATKGVFVTTSSFASSAQEFVQRISKRIILIDGDELARFMIKHNVGVRTRVSCEIKSVDEDYFAESES